MKKDLKDNILFGQNTQKREIPCQEARKIIDETKNTPKPSIDNLILAMEHTRTCKDCGDYFIQLNKV